MEVCENCFESESISHYIVEDGRKLEEETLCSFCEEESLYRLLVIDLRTKVQSIIRECYTHEHGHGLIGSAGMMMEDGDNIDDYLPCAKDLKTVCYELFELDTINDKFYELLEDDYDSDSEFDGDTYSEVWIAIGREWDGSSHIMLNWDEFCENVKHKARFFDHSSYSRIEELKKLDRTFDALSSTVSLTLYRARNANQTKTFKNINSDPSKELGIVPPQYAKHNRFSPVGIPYVYMSSDNETIVKEIRAKQGDTIGIGTFKIENLKLIDLRNQTLEEARTNPFSIHFTDEILCSSNLLKSFISDITKPVHDSDAHLDYIPTQIVSEYIWSLGYDGFIFDSSLCSGDNYVLFKDTYTYLSYEIKEV